MSDKADAGVPRVLWKGEQGGDQVRVVAYDDGYGGDAICIEWLDGYWAADWSDPAENSAVAGHLARLLAEAQRERDEAIAKLEDYEKLSRERAADQAVGLMRGAITPQRKRRLGDVTDTPDNIARRGEGLPDEF